MSSPKKNVAYEFYVSLIDSSDTGAFKANPTIASGDFKTSKDGSDFANLATLPVVDPAGSIGVLISLAQAEMNGDKIMVQCIDAAGDEWDDLLIFIDVTTVNVDDLVDVYHADIELTRDGQNTQDEYTITWIKNGVQVTSGITSPTIRVINRADGTDLVAAGTAMTEIGSTSLFGYDEGTNRMTPGEAVIVIVSATIDSVSRSFPRVLTRDADV